MKGFIEKAVIFFGLIMVCFAVMPNAVVNLSILFWAIFSVINYLLEKDYRVTKTEKIHLVLFSSTFLFYLLGLIHTENMEVGSVEVQKRVGLIIFPIAGFMFTRVTTKNIQTIIKNVFVVCVFVHAIAVAAYVFYEGLLYVNSDQWSGTYLDLIQSPNFVSLYRYKHAYWSTNHTVYSGLFYAVCILLMLDLLFQFTTLKKKIGLILAIIMMLIFLALLGSRSALLGLFASTLVYLFIKIKRRRIKIMSIVSIVLITVFTSLLIPTIRERLNETFTTELDVGTLENHNSTNVRVGILHCVKEILKPNWVLGIGTGDVQDNLNSCYEGLGAEILIDHQYNAHNEYLTVWLIVGVLGFLIFTASLLYPLYFAFQSHNYLYIAFLILMMICFLTENVLSRLDGVAVYGFFNVFLAFRKRSVKNSLEKE